MAITAPDSAPFRYPKPLRRGAACLNCRKSKQACDAVQPECGPCLLRHRQCEYAPLVGPVKKRQQKVVELESQLKDEGGSSTRISPTPSNTSKGSFKVASPSSRGTSTNGMSDDASSPTASRSTDGTSPASSYDISSPSSQLHSISPTSSTPRGLDTALAEQEPPGLDTDYPRKMLATILPYRDHFGLDIDVSHWLETINLPLSHPGSFHPCLLNAICLAGTSISGSGETQRVWEKHFYQAARRQMQESLSLCDRLDDWFYTSLLLLGYGLLRTSPTCILEICQSSLPMAVACNLHRQGKPADYAQQDYGLLQPARNASHANDRINMWWTLWTMDKRIANSMDIQEAFPYRDPEVVTTPLPLPKSTIELVRGTSGLALDGKFLASYGRTFSTDMNLLHGERCRICSCQGTLIWTSQTTLR
ncbi:hypothetical protein DL93DRAFT_2111194 [Clavulina sp. PMI_390]|nr:hypothetical protein DL93DRAFT_2111194 [Clavulina sp. PMI_390]